MIVVLGSINLDIVVRVPRLPGEGETVSGTGHAMLPGGKGANQAVAARRAGAEVALFGAVGEDAFAEPALVTLRQTGVDLTGVRVMDRATGLATIAVDEAGANAIAVSPGANQLAALPDDWSPAGEGVLLTQNEVLPEPLFDAWARAKAAGWTVVHNAAPARGLSREEAANLDVLVVNEHEFATVAGAHGVGDRPSPGNAGRLARTIGCSVVVTLGAAGALAAGTGGELAMAKAPRVDVVDTTGAGDATCGALAVALFEGMALDRALAFAVTAGSLACTVEGAQPSSPDRAAIEAAL